MTVRVVIDPVTRVGGHLRIACEVEPAHDGSHRVSAAYNSATLFRGIGPILAGRDPLEAWHLASRICGTCPTSHGIASAQAVEQALGLTTVPENARLVRNMLEAAEIAQNHIVWFYQLNLPDYVDAAKASTAARPRTESLVRLRDDLRAQTSGSRPGPFSSGWWEHPAYRIPPEVALELMGHYVEALSVQAKAASAAASLGGRSPMVMNLAAGGLTALPEIPAVLDYQHYMREVRDFVDRVMAPDLLVLASYHGDELAASGRSWGNYLSWGVLDGKSQDPYDRLFPRGMLLATESQDRRIDPTQVHLFTGRSFYPDEAGRGRHPISVRQLPTRFVGFDDPTGKYDWTQAPRLGPDAVPAETGPLAQLLIAYSRGRPDVVRLTDRLIDELVSVGVRIDTTHPLDVLRSTLGRILARVVKARIVAENAVRWADELLDSVGRRDKQFFFPRLVPEIADGTGAWDAPRGALAHWVRIRDTKISAYSVVTPSGWNLSPRDDEGVPGPLERALEGQLLADPDRPLEILRVVHGFDPCMGCAVHVLDARARR